MSTSVITTRTGLISDSGRLWDKWKEPLILVTPRTVVGWHGAGFRLYWKWLSRARPTGGRKPVSKEIRALRKLRHSEPGAPHLA